VRYLKNPPWTECLAHCGKQDDYPYIPNFNEFARLEAYADSFISEPQPEKSEAGGDEEQAAMNRIIEQVLPPADSKDKNLIVCQACGGRVKQQEVQLRRSDEGATLFYSCQQPACRLFQKALRV